MKSWFLFVVLMFLSAPSFCVAQNSTFTYQGRLIEDYTPAHGFFDMQFGVFPSKSGGSPLGSLVQASGVAVTNGLFTVELNFGANVFEGSPRWLQIAVATNDSASFNTLTPRQAISSVPYAIRAAIATAVPTGSITGEMLANGSISATHLAPGSITSDRLASNSVGPAQLSRMYQSGSLPYTSLNGFPAGFESTTFDQPITFPVPFRISPVITLSIDTPHPGLASKGAPLITSRTPNGFTMRVSTAPVGVEVVRAPTKTLLPDLTVVNGHPAMIGNGSVGFSVGLIYARALDPNGTTWAAPSLLQTGYPGAAKLLVAVGNPMVVFQNNVGTLSAVRSADANGATWPTPTQIVGPTNGTITEMAATLISGYPAVLFVAQNNVFFMRSSNSTGTAWNAPLAVYSGGSTNVDSISLCRVADRPAYAIQVNSSTIRYARAHDTNGSAWPVSIVAVQDPTPGDPGTGLYGSVSLVETLGNFPPLSISYREYKSSPEFAVRAMLAAANTAIGSSWGSTQSLTPFESSVAPALRSISDNAVPRRVLAYVRNGNQLLYSNTGGGGNAQELEPADFGCDVALVNGEVAIAFYGQGSLRFIRRGTPPPQSAVNWIALEP